MKSAFSLIKRPITRVSKGFTLIELMVVIAIIAILSVVGITVFSNVQKGARDTRRRSDINAIAKALETKKSPGAGVYVVLAGTDFAGGGIPVDSANGSATYCQASGAVAGTPPAAATSVTWPNNSTVCPTGYSSITVGSPPSTGASWTICAFLETSAIPYCRSSSQ